MKAFYLGLLLLLTGFFIGLSLSKSDKIDQEIRLLVKKETVTEKSYRWQVLLVREDGKKMWAGDNYYTGWGTCIVYFDNGETISIPLSSNDVKERKVLRDKPVATFQAVSSFLEGK